MNVEFIYIILLSINGFMENLESQDSMHSSNPHNKITIDKNAKGTKIKFQ